ncbi:MAG: hypothetical protein [Microvirus sp.]|nr:MAG: hypothetical protein [Microvirus sp.]
MFRKKMGRSASKKHFTRNATGHHKKNFSSNPMRGGIRL